MNVLTLKITAELDAALQAASVARGLSKSAVAREALEHSLVRHAEHTSAERWVAQWRGRLTTPQGSSAAKRAPGKTRVNTAAAPDPRLAHLLAKHLR